MCVCVWGGRGSSYFKVCCMLMTHPAIQVQCAVITCPSFLTPTHAWCAFCGAAWLGFTIHCHQKELLLCIHTWPLYKIAKYITIFNRWPECHIVQKTTSICIWITLLL